MSVSLRVTGSWAELIADGSVAIPATPQAGDRMYLFARWKDFSVTATVANWTELEEFADGSSSSGNGTGSVKVACWYRDWQPGDTDPTIDFSAAPENASVVITVMAKGPDDVWLTPVARTAAMTNWTTTSQSVSASATVTVPSSGVVIGLIGIRDDTAVMTRPTNGIDDAGGLVAWNGNYVESPATHHSTTTGDDGAADLGYRLVTTGTAGVTLRMTGTISAAETGAALWVVQGVSVQVTPGNATLTSSQFAPQLKLAVTPVNASLVSSGFAPQLRLVVTPAASALTLTPSAPLVGMGVVPASATLSTTTFAPMLSLRITPPAATLTLTPFTTQLQETLTPANVSLSVVGFAPIVGMVFTPAAASLTLTPFAPTVVQNILITVTNAALALTTNQPHVLPFKLIFLDPGGDAVQAAGYFHAPIAGSTGAVTFDSTQKVVGVGSYKFDSEDGEISAVGVAGILGGVDGAARRISTYFRYDSVPDAFTTSSDFVISFVTIYSGDGFITVSHFADGDNGAYATATPAKNSGQGSVSDISVTTPAIPASAVIDSVKIIYERKYDVDTSVGISRVKWELDGEEGPNHDNTDMPLTDTVVEVDVTNDRTWESQHFQGARLKVIAEARRGDTDTEHTQSWDYVKVEVVWHAASVILQGRQLSTLGFRVALKPAGSDVVLRLLDDNDEAYDGITHLAVNEWNRISVSYALVGEEELGINLYVNGIPELSITTAFPFDLDWPLDLEYGWVRIPGANHVCWFDQIAVDNGDDLTDIGNILSTAKLPATVNENNWDTTGGTGAVNERPLSETNYMQHAAVSAVRQTYTLQAASVGDIDISGETLIGYMGWVWTKVADINDIGEVYLVVNNEDQFVPIDTSPMLFYKPATTTSYPSHAAGVGMVSNTGFTDTLFYEGGAIIAYEGPLHPDLLLPRQLVNNESLATIIDDLRADPPDSYEVCCAFPEFDGTVEITIHSLDQDGGSVSYQGTLNSNGRVRITPGVEVYLDVTVVGVTNLQIWRRLNVD